ncbi:hypothetical protein O181_050337 [Austropuccinia psidii MF-1]|uniref:Uncharacterized protein n=1 Tax=Austropuccinia psidii MF-1 TaxID=1389203 RepID=A0A9Q3DYR6_9BASI|nr:hypothetical protein [Austropuccinia psidii MF-1]
MEILHQYQQSQTPKGSPKCDIWDGLGWRCFTGTRSIYNPPIMSLPGALAISIYVDWFNAHGKSTHLASIGPMMLICLNLPQMKHQGKSRVNRWRLTSRRTAVSIKSCFSRVSVTL